MNKKISMDDLNDQKIDSSLEKLKDKEKIIEQKQARIATNDDDSSPKSKYRSISNFIFIGLFSSMLGWSFAEQFTRPDTINRPFNNVFNLNLSSVMFFTIVGLFLFFLLIYWEIIVYSFSKDVALSLTKVLPICFFLLFVTSAINNGVYSYFRNNIYETSSSLDFETLLGALSVVRAISWGIWGLLSGAILGIFPSMNRKKIINGAIGGLIGGAIGGFGFNPITNLIRDGFQTDIELLGTYPGALARFIAILFVGLSVGISIGLVKAFRSKYWIEILSGGMAGKQFLFESNEITFGSMYKNDITLIKDPKIPEYAFKINTESSTPFVVNDAYFSYLEVDNINVETSHKLNSGSIITVGDTVLKFFTKE